MAQLETSQLAAIRLVYVSGLTQAQAAVRLNVSERVVGRRVAKALAQLGAVPAGPGRDGHPSVRPRSRGRFARRSSPTDLAG